MKEMPVRILLSLVFLLAAYPASTQEIPPPPAGRVERAETLLRQDDSHLARWQSMVFALMERDGPGDRARAVDVAEEATRKFPVASEAWSLKARAQLFHGRFRKAGEDARAALEIRQANPEALQVLGEVLLGQGHLDEAREVLTGSSRLGPIAIESFVLLASLYEREKLYPMAADSLETYLERRPKSPSEFSRGEDPRVGKLQLLRAMGPRTPFSIDGDATSTTVSIESTRGGIYLVRVKPNGKKARWFDIDSGSDGILISRSLQRRLNLKTVSENPVTGIGGRVVQAHSAILDSLTIGDITVRNLPVQVLDRFPKHKEHRVDGSLGQPFLREFIVTMDFPAETLTLDLPRRSQARSLDRSAGPGRRAVKYTVPMRYPSITLGTWDGGKDIPFLWDTGAGLSVIDEGLVETSDLPMDLEEEDHKGKVGTGKEVIYRKLVNSYQVRVGKFDFGMQPAVIDLRAVNHMTPYIGGIIGTDVMKEFIVTLDYFRNEIRLEWGNPGPSETLGK